MMTESPVSMYAVVVRLSDGSHISYGPFVSLDFAKKYALNFDTAQTYPIYEPTLH